MGSKFLDPAVWNMNRATLLHPCQCFTPIDFCFTIEQGQLIRYQLMKDGKVVRFPLLVTKELNRFLIGSKFNLDEALDVYEYLFHVFEKLTPEKQETFKLLWNSHPED